MSRQSQLVHSDLNRLFGESNASEILLGKDAINQSLFNIFNIFNGEAAPIFQPDLGSSVPSLIHEPMDEITALRIESAVFQSVAKWEPRIKVDVGQSSILADDSSQSYRVTLVYQIRSTGEESRARFKLSPIPREYRAPFSVLEKLISLHRIGWPGTYQFCLVSGGTLMSNNSTLEYWSSPTDWASFLTWGSTGSTTMVYTTIVDHHSEIPRKVQAIFSDDISDQNVLVEVSVSSDGLSFSPFTVLTSNPMSFRFMQFRVTLTATPSVEMQLTRGDLYFYI